MRCVTFIAIVLLISALTVVSCGKKLTPVELNNELSAINDTLSLKGRTWGIAFSQAMVSRDFSSMTPARKDMEAFVEDKIAYVKRMEDVNGSKEFRENEIEFLKFEKNIISSTFKPFEAFTANTTEAEFNKAYTDLAAASGEENVRLAKLQQLQQEYAEKNNFKILPDR